MTDKHDTGNEWRTWLMGLDGQANPSIGVLDVMNRLGAESGTDESGNSHVAFNCFSLGEIVRVAAAGVDVSKRVIFSGLGKTHAEIDEAVKKGVYLFNVESIAELEVVESIARKHNKEVNVSIRVNPDISLSAITPDGQLLDHLCPLLE